MSNYNNSFKKVFLVLSREFRPIFFLNYKDAFLNYYLNKAEVIEFYPIEDLSIRTVDRIFQVPAVLKTNVPFKYFYSRVPNKLAIYIRDNRTCAYCGKICSDDEITVDHIIPKSKGGKWSWENLVTCCLECNRKKKNNIWVPKYAKPRPIEHIKIQAIKYWNSLHPVLKEYLKNEIVKKEKKGKT